MDRDLHRPNYRVHDRGESGVLGCAYLVDRASHVVHANMMANMDPEASIEILARPSEATRTNVGMHVAAKRVVGSERRARLLSRLLKSNAPL